MKEIMNRKSTRRFENKIIEKEKMEKLLYAAMQAPSALNMQPWEFVIVENKELLQQIGEMSPYSKPAIGASLGIVLLEKKIKEIPLGSFRMDLGAVAQNILLEAEYLDLGAVWLGVGGLENNGVSYLTELLELPEGEVSPVAVIALGYPLKIKGEVSSRFNPEKVHYEKW